MVSPVTLLGPDIDHRLSLQAMLQGAASVNWTPDSNSFFKDRPASLPARLLRRVERLFGTRNHDYLTPLLRQLDEHRTDTVIAFWGTEPLSDLLAIRRLRPKVKLVLMVLCYPVALNRAGVARQNWMMRRATKVLDGILFPNEAMRRYFVEQGLCSADLPALLLPPCWPAAFQSPGPRAPALDRPNLIFTGRTDLSANTIHAADDLRPLMNEILGADIELHHVYSKETDDGHPLRRTFKPQEQSDLIARMAAHDASLIAYNTAACERDDRFWLTVPDRLITSVAAGVPVAVPRKGYTGLKQYLVNYPAMLEFDHGQDLHEQLADRARMAQLHEQAWQSRQHYTAEQQAPLLQRFLEGLNARR
ncbi:MAG: hypothetical protein EOP38_01775 [Rubrivivax sp.]|nr:MAG: hypothetical protein EOP38_01775 [Rubrivivax sp.]